MALSVNRDNKSIARLYIEDQISQYMETSQNSVLVALALITEVSRN